MPNREKLGFFEIFEYIFDIPEFLLTTCPKSSLDISVSVSFLDQFNFTAVQNHIGNSFAVLAVTACFGCLLGPSSSMYICPVWNLVNH